MHKNALALAVALACACATVPPLPYDNSSSSGGVRPMPTNADRRADAIIFASSSAAVGVLSGTVVVVAGIGEGLALLGDDPAPKVAYGALLVIGLVPWVFNLLVSGPASRAALIEAFASADDEAAASSAARP